MITGWEVTTITMTTIFTDDQIASALLSLKTPRVDEPKTKKQRKTLMKEKRSQNLKTWHQIQRAVKEREAAKKRNRSEGAKRMWAKRKAAAAM